MKSSENHQSAIGACSYALGPLRLDAARAFLARDGEPLPAGPRVVATLAVLVARRGDVVTKDEILDAVWPGEDVGESNVAQSVYVARKLLREHGLGECIRTVPRRGYRYTGPAAPVASPSSVLPSAPAFVPPPPAFVPPPPALAPQAALRATLARAARTALLAAAAMLIVVGAGGVGGAGGFSLRGRPAALSARGGELYRLGRYYWNTRTHAGLARSVALFAAVTRSDPDSALGYAGLAGAHLMIADYEGTGRTRPALYAAALRESQAALRRDPDSVDALAASALLRDVAFHDRTGAEAIFVRALALDPQNPTVRLWYGTLLSEEGRDAGALAQFEAAVALDPASGARSHWLAETAYRLRRYRETIEYARRAYELSPERHGTLRTLGLAYEAVGDHARALATFRRIRRTGDATTVTVPALLAEAYARAGDVARARSALRTALRSKYRDYDTAMALLALGERERAVAVLRTMPAVDAGEADWRADPLRGDHRVRFVPTTT